MTEMLPNKMDIARPSLALAINKSFPASINVIFITYNIFFRASVSDFVSEQSPFDKKTLNNELIVSRWMSGTHENRSNVEAMTFNNYTKNKSIFSTYPTVKV